MEKLLLRYFHEKMQVELIYLSDKGDISQRTVYIKQWSNTYFKAFCYTKMGYRTFKVKNVLSVQRKSLKGWNQVG